MVKHFDHLTIVVRDTVRAKAFLAVLGFMVAMSVFIALFLTVVSHHSVGPIHVDGRTHHAARS